MDPLTTLEPDILIARTTVTFAQSQRFLASLLRPRAADDAPSVQTRTTATERNDSAKQREERGAFTPSASDEWGLGAPLAETENGDGEEVMVDERLRIQLLGREHVKKQAKAKRGREAGAVALAMRMGRTPVPPAPAKREVEERRDGDGDALSDDDGGGRSSLGKAKNGARGSQRLEEREPAPAVEGVGDDESARVRAPRGAGNYLDEVLADLSLTRRRKEEKKKKKKEDGSVDG